MRLLLVPFLALALVCTTSTASMAQRVTPVAATQRVWESPGVSAQNPVPVAASHPRPRVVAPVAFAFGVAGGVAGYYAAEESCSRSTTTECYAQLLQVPLGYTIGVILGGGIAGTAEGCRTASLRALGGGLLGLVAGALSASGVQPVGIILLPAGPLVGATWLVARCRTVAGAAGSREDR